MASTLPNMNHETAIGMSEAFRRTAFVYIKALDAPPEKKAEIVLKNAAFFAVSAANLSFAIEIALKTLLSLSGIDFRQRLRNKDRHDLFNLFGLLSQDKRSQLAVTFAKGKQERLPYGSMRIVKGPWGGEVDEDKVRDEAKPHVSHSLSESLETARANFVEWRYLYDRTDDQRYFTFEVDNLLLAHRVILDDTEKLLAATDES